MSLAGCVSFLAALLLLSACLCAGVAHAQPIAQIAAAPLDAPSHTGFALSNDVVVYAYAPAGQSTTGSFQRYLVSGGNLVETGPSVPMSYTNVAGAVFAINTAVSAIYDGVKWGYFMTSAAVTPLVMRWDFSTGTPVFGGYAVMNNLGIAKIDLPSFLYQDQLYIVGSSAGSSVVANIPTNVDWGLGATQPPPVATYSISTDGEDGYEQIDAAAYDSVAGRAYLLSNGAGNGDPALVYTFAFSTNSITKNNILTDTNTYVFDGGIFDGGAPGATYAYFWASGSLTVTPVIVRVSFGRVGGGILFVIVYVGIYIFWNAY